MFLNTNLYVGIPSNQIYQNTGGTLGVITAFNSESGTNENILSFTAKCTDEQDARLKAQYLIKEKNNTIWVWLGENANPIEGKLLDIKTHSDHANHVTYDKIEVIFKTSF
ncbi:hypothetical protein [Dickeya fangzhongdai]|uniref:hypothetical protein n=1 Tax=Dickeya fangzhongdai TaxID=1778540 RepID=UPI0004F58B6F|nr:hypothetical protein [Dickeya fangzhongdai]AIR71469.1 hypothetical protein LH89_20490 [Dickeya fangzhongdai]KGT98497.1 hypothetical protein NM75_09225 [Dickeya fangzhongdai]